MFSKDYKWKLYLWTNLLMCKLDRRSKEEVLDGKPKITKKKKKEVIENIDEEGEHTAE